MTRLYLKNYLNEAYKTYENARSEYLKNAKQREDLEQKYTDERKKGFLNAEGLKRLEENYKKEKEQLENEWQKINDNYNEEVNAIRKRIDNVFKDLYISSPEQLDNNTMQILNSGILTEQEIKEYANKFSNNPTMRRIIGKYILDNIENIGTRESETEMRKLAIVLSNKEPKHLEAIDSIINLSNMALRKDIRLANGIANRYDELTNGLFESDIAIDTPNIVIG